MCIARAWFAIVFAGEGAIVIARSAQEKQFPQFFSQSVAVNPLAWRVTQRCNQTAGRSKRFCGKSGATAR
jgi:hypothetical protein